MIPLSDFTLGFLLGSGIMFFIAALVILIFTNFTVKMINKHDVCENSRDCILCNDRIQPAAGICFACVQKQNEEWVLF